MLLLLPETGRAAAQPFRSLSEVHHHLPFVFKVKLTLSRFLSLATKNPVNIDAHYTAH